MSTIEVTADGCPLHGTLIFEDVDRDDMAEGAWILDTTQATAILDTWQSAPKKPDVTRAWAYFESGYFITALTMEGETNIDNWESEGTSTFSTANMPLDLTIIETGTE